MPSPQKHKGVFYVLTTLVTLVISLVSAWAYNADVEIKENRERTHRLEVQLPLIDYKLDLLLKAHGIEVPKEAKK